MKHLFKYLLITVICMPGVFEAQAQQSGYHTTKTFHIAGDGGWDYLAVNSDELYVSHGDHVNIINKRTGDSIGSIRNTTGVHGIAFIPAMHKGYTSNGRLNTVTVFDLPGHKVLAQIKTGQNPDAILYDPYSKKVITCNGRSNNLSLIDPVTNTVTDSIAVGGRPETAVSDEAGKLFVNVEDKNEIVEVDLRTKRVDKRWSLKPAEGPTGLAFDQQTRRLFAGCDHLLAVIDATTGKLVDTVAIGDGCDGVAFDPQEKTIFASNGEGTVTVIKELSADKYVVQGNVPTKKGARTIAFDESTHTIYLPTADLQQNADPHKRPSMVPGTFQVLVLEK